VGAEAGVAQRSIDFLNLRWGTQHDNQGGFDPTLPSQEENFNRDNFLFADLAAGLLWFTVFDEGSNFYVGGAFHHLNRANQSFIDPDSPAAQDGGLEEDLIYSRYTIHAGGEFPLNERVGLVPGAIYMSQGPSYQLNAGTSFKFLLGNPRDKQSFQIGLWARIASELDQGFLTDAAILSTRFDFNDLSLGFSYDINISPLQPASNGQGSFEFAMVYKICGMQRRNIYCPEF
jgi:type IX secretion system PorP/SprF family membrane protein